MYKIYDLDESWLRFYIGMAKYAATKSKDPSTKVGAVIVRPDKTVASIGINGFPRGIKDTHERLHNRDLKYPIIIHAEKNAILNSRDPSLSGYIMFVAPLHPCAPCSSMIIQSGIKFIVTESSQNERWQESCATASEILFEAGVTVVTLPTQQ